MTSDLDRNRGCRFRFAFLPRGRKEIVIRDRRVSQDSENRFRVAGLLHCIGDRWMTRMHRWLDERLVGLDRQVGVLRGFSFCSLWADCVRRQLLPGQRSYCVPGSSRFEISQLVTELRRDRPVNQIVTRQSTNDPACRRDVGLLAQPCRRWRVGFSRSQQATETSFARSANCRVPPPSRSSNRSGGRSRFPRLRSSL